MTLALCGKVNAGMVIAADSASTLTNQSGDVVNVYLNANKVFNLYKGLPVGLVTYGLGEINGSSISILAKDFRIVSKDPGSPYYIDPNQYLMQEIADKFTQFIFDEHYKVDYTDPTIGPNLGFFIAGFSSGERFGESYSLEMGSNANGVNGPNVNTGPGPYNPGLAWNGQPEAVQRLLLGFGTSLPSVGGGLQCVYSCVIVWPLSTVGFNLR